MTLRSNLGKEASVRTRNANSLQSVQAASRPLSLFGVPGRCSLATKSHLTLLHRERPDKAARSMTVECRCSKSSRIARTLFLEISLENRSVYMLTSFSQSIALVYSDAQKIFL